MLRRIRIAIDQRDTAHKLAGIVDFDDAYFGGPTTGQKRGRGTEQTKEFVALTLDARGNPQLLKMQVTKNIKQASVKRFAERTVKSGSTIRSDGYRSYIPALRDYPHEHKTFDPQSGMLHWLHHGQQCQGIHSGHLPWPAESEPPVLPGRVLFLL